MHDLDLRPQLPKIGAGRLQCCGPLEGLFATEPVPLFPQTELGHLPPGARIARIASERALEGEPSPFDATQREHAGRLRREVDR